MREKLIHKLYVRFLRPLMFKLDAEFVHDKYTKLGCVLAKYPLTRKLIQYLFDYEDSRLIKRINGIEFNNPIGLSAGFDYDGKMVGIFKYVGFGFNTVGTVTFQPYEGNAGPRLVRMPKSQSILVNKGFKSQGVHKVVERLNDPKYKDITFGVSVGSSNIPEVDTIDKAIYDYLASFEVLETCTYIKYYELNISCPNTMLTENFTEKKNYELLFKKVAGLKLSKPVFVKMPNELDNSICDDIVATAIQNGINSFIFSNLVKDRTNPALDKQELDQIKHLKGNFSGKPTALNVDNKISFFRSKYGNTINLIWCGGVFTPEDAKHAFLAGADLVQLITGMIYEGPQLIGSINRSLSIHIK